MKQMTYAVNTTDKTEKNNFAKSGLCLIRDWNYGMFEVPDNMKNEFRKKFGILPRMEASSCEMNITSERINQINMNNWGSIMTALLRG